MLRYGIAAEIVTLAFNQSNDFEILQGMYDPLLTYDANLQPTPHLVESWEQNSDLTQIKLNLRQGVLFHNGREFTARMSPTTFSGRLIQPKVPGPVGRTGQGLDR